MSRITDRVRFAVYMHMLELAIGFVIDNERSLSSGGRYRA